MGIVKAIAKWQRARQKQEDDRTESSVQVLRTGSLILLFEKKI